MIYLFVLDDSLTSRRFTTRTEDLTKCYEPLQKLGLRLWPCKTGLNPPVTFCYRSFQGDTSVVVIFVLCLCVLIFCVVGALCMFSYF